MLLRRINISAALIILVCFFLPWVQVSCGAATQTLSGFDLARDDRVLLWLVPIAMISVLAMFLWRSRKESGATAAILSAVSGAITALLLNRERMRAQDSVALIAAQLTGWFWLSFIAALAIVISSIGLLVRKRAT